MIVMYLLLFVWLLRIAVHNYYKGTFLKETVLLMLRLALRDSPNKILREAALIFVAVSAGFKLYPALFGFLWIAEKRYKEAARLVLYGLLAFFVPFFFVDSFTNYLSTFIQYLDKKMYSHASVWGMIINIFGDNRYTQVLCRGIVAVIILWALFSLFADGINWKTITLLMATQTMTIPEQYIYTYVFIMISLVFFLMKQAGEKSTICMRFFLPPCLRRLRF